MFPGSHGEPISVVLRLSLVDGLQSPLHQGEDLFEKGKISTHWRDPPPLQPVPLPLGLPSLAESLACLGFLQYKL
jgi:hypothetical protein